MSSHADGWRDEDETELGPYPARGSRPSVYGGIYSHGFTRATGCPRCQAVNQLRKRERLEPVVQCYRVRAADLALWCYRCDDFFRSQTVPDLLKSAGLWYL